MATKAHIEGNQRHLEKLDRIVFYVAKGRKQEIAERAKAVGEKSTNAYLVRLVDEDMEKPATHWATGQKKENNHEKY